MPKYQSTKRCRLLACLVAFSLAAGGRGAEPLNAQIDALIAAETPGYATKAAPLADDAEFLRRLTLDLTGTIPTAEQARAFIDDQAPAKRSQLIDRLLTSAEYARHMAYVFDNLLMDRRPDKHVPAADWQRFLRESFAANRPLDQWVREILSADGADAKSRPAAKFYLERDAEPHQLTRDLSRVFLGMNLTCCQCHDHPLVNSYKQDHYYGVYSFLSRSQLFAEGKPVALAEKADGDATFTSVFDTAKVIHTAAVRLPFGMNIAEPKLEKGKEYKVAPAKGVRPVPHFSRRAQLAPALTSSRQFARTMVNRLWAQMLGRGLVHPVDFDHKANPPSHPKLLELLTTEFSARKFDVRALLRELALSHTYQRASRSAAAVTVGPERFASAALKPLAPEQLAWSLMTATGLPDAQRNDATVRTFVNTFGGKVGEPAGDFQTTLDQTLFVANGSMLRQWLARPGGLADRAAKMQDTAAAEALFLSVLSRRPVEAEARAVAAYLQGRAQDRPNAMQELTWALMASVEFRFNH